MTTYRWTNALAMGLAAGAVAYQSAVIWEMLEGVSTTTKLGVPLATISAAMLPVLAEAAWRGGERVKSLLLFLPVFVLMAFVLPSGVSRLGEAQQARIQAATISETDQVRIRADLAKATALVAEADKWAASECATGKGKKCQGLEFILGQRRAYQKELQAKVDSIKPVPTPWLPAWHPATLPIGLECAIVVLLFYGFGPLTHTHVRVHQTVAPVRTITERDFSVDPITDEEIDELRRILGLDGCNNKTLALRLGCSEGQASKITSAAVAAGKVLREKCGREVRISALH